MARGWIARTAFSFGPFCLDARQVHLDELLVTEGARVHGVLNVGDARGDKIEGTGLGSNDAGEAEHQSHREPDRSRIHIHVASLYPELESRCKLDRRSTVHCKISEFSEKFVRTPPGPASYTSVRRCLPQLPAKERVERRR